MTKPSCTQLRTECDHARPFAALWSQEELVEPEPAPAPAAAAMSMEEMIEYAFVAAIVQVSHVQIPNRTFPNVNSTCVLGTCVDRAWMTRSCPCRSPNSTPST